MTLHATMPSVDQSVQMQARQLQKCLTALEKIRAIMGVGSPVWRLADDAIQNRPVVAGGTDD